MKNPPRLLVLGSANVDLGIRVARLPSPGETIGGGSFARTFGGKGANTAVAAARAGARVSFAGCVGIDAAGTELLAALRAERIDLAHVVRTPRASTGTAIIMVDDTGANCIAVAPGANARFTPAMARALRGAVRDSALMLLQCEIPWPTVVAALELAAAENMPAMLNLAPARRISRRVLRLVDTLVVNETEAEAVSSCEVSDERSCQRAAETIRKLGARHVVITLGRRGCALLDDAGYSRLPAYRVRAVDSTAAGDIFCGNLAVALAEGSSLPEAARFASAAAALSVTRRGAQSSAPRRNEVEAFLRRQRRYTQRHH